MSSNDSLIAGFFGVIGVVVGVLLDRRLKTQERKEVKAERVVLLASMVSSQLGGLLSHIGKNRDRLEPILAENLEGKSPSKSDFESMITNALLAYPLPIPLEIPFPKDDQYGYTLAAISASIMNDVREANTAADNLKAGKRDAEHVSKFIVMNDKAVSKNIILHAASRQFESYLDTLGELYGRKMKKEEKDMAVKKLTSDLEHSYSIAVEMGESLDGYTKVAEDYLRKVGW